MECATQPLRRRCLHCREHQRLWKPFLSVDYSEPSPVVWNFAPARLSSALCRLADVLRQCAEPKAAVREYCRVVNRMPCCWSAWESLVSLLEASPEAAVAALPLPAHWVTKLFWCKLHLASHRNKQALSLVHDLLVDLPASTLLQSLAAQALYNLRRK